jgi:fatty acid-binding protein DegV
VAILFDGTSPADVETITQGLADRVPESAIIAEQYGPIIATHVGPGALGLCVFAEPGKTG